jgi:hypothetical protein
MGKRGNMGLLYSYTKTKMEQRNLQFYLISNLSLKTFLQEFFLVITKLTDTCYNDEWVQDLSYSA